MPITPDQDFTVVPANFQSRAYAKLQGLDLFFYVTQGTNELRVKSFTDQNAHLLGVNMSFVCLIQTLNVVHLYFADVHGTMSYAPFTIANFSAPLVTSPVSVGQARTFSAAYAPLATPPVYALLVDDGFYHTIYTSQTPNFASLQGQLRVYNNSIDTAHYVTEPVISIHPNDTVACTVHARQVKLSDSSSKVGFYTLKLPGVV